MPFQHPQQPFNFPLNQDFRLDNYLAGDNQQLVTELEYIHQQATGFLYLWGETGVGCSHLLQGACQHAVEQGVTAMYLPLGDIIDYGTGVLDNLESLELVCLDELDAVAGLVDWEEALFHLYNRLQAAGHGLIVAAHSPPNHLGISLADLGSRLASGAVYQVQGLTEANQLCLLQQRAQLKGLELPDDVAQYIVNRSGRSNAALCQLMDKLDRVSLAAQRKLTVPFVKQVMGW